MDYATDYCAEICIRYNAKISEDRVTVSSAISVVDLMLEIEYFQENIEYKEMFYALYINSCGKIISVLRVCEGTVESACVDTRFIMQGAILQNASALVVVHNHPSGSTKPSPEDVSLTHKILECCKLFNIKLLDHVIISCKGYCSFAEQGIL